MADVPPKNSGVHLWLVLMKAHRAVSRHAIKSIEPSGLGLSDFAVLELLLSKGADVNAQDGHFGTALQAASYSG